MPDAQAQAGHFDHHYNVANHDTLIALCYGMQPA